MVQESNLNILHKSFGKIEFDPIDKTKKHIYQSDWKKTAIIHLDCDIHLYYSWFLKKRYNLILNEPLRNAHVTIISDRIDTEELIDKYIECKNKWNNKIVEFEYSVDIRSDGFHWWLPVTSVIGQQIRNDAMIGDPHFGFHLNIGNAMQPLMKQHSEYILGLIKSELPIS